MRCPYCGYRESKVVDSRPADEGSSIRRRRDCLSCMRRFTTYETVESLPMVVIKKDGSRQSFDRNKVLRGTRPPNRASSCCAQATMSRAFARQKPHERMYSPTSSGVATA